MKIGLIGKTLTHSYSPLIHEIISGYKYELINLNEDELDKWIENKEYDAYNVTIPYKEKVIPFLDELDDVSKTVKAVNTVVKKGDKLFGYNTDYMGFIFMLKQNKINVYKKRVLILGTGGSSKTVKKAMIDLGASEVYLVSRSEKRNCITYQEAIKKFKINIIVNTTPYGMYPNYEDIPLIDLNYFPYLEACVDLIYNPLKTPLIVAAQEKGVKSVSGLLMLVAQACFAEELFLNKKIPVDEIMRIYREILLTNYNIVFVGMPSSGKSTASINLSEELKKERYDTDEEIIKKIGMSINDYFALNGEESFRKIESEIVKELSTKRGVIISTGGGTLTKKENILPLIRNSIVIFLNRGLALLKENKYARETRPLLKDDNSIDELYKQRYKAYHTYSDIEIANNGSKQQTLQVILGRLK